MVAKAAASAQFNSGPAAPCSQKWRHLSSELRFKLLPPIVNADLQTFSPPGRVTHVAGKSRLTDPSVFEINHAIIEELGEKRPRLKSHVRNVGMQHVARPARTQERSRWGPSSRLAAPARASWTRIWTSMDDRAFFGFYGSI